MSLNIDMNMLRFMQKRFPAGRWSFLGPGSEKKWFSTSNERPRGEWDRVVELMITNSETADTQFSVPQVHCLEECSKVKVVENYQHTFTLMGKRLKLFFAQLFLVISSVYTEQSQMCVMNTVLVKQERGDPCWQDNLTPLFVPTSVMKTPTFSTEIPAPENLLQKYEEQVERLSQKKTV